jgi:hypothetical protein
VIPDRLGLDVAHLVENLAHVEVQLPASDNKDPVMRPSHVRHARLVDARSRYALPVLGREGKIAWFGPEAEVLGKEELQRSDAPAGG